MRIRGASLALAMTFLGSFGLAASAGTGWCLGFGSLGPVRTGMTVEQVLRLADWPGMERKRPDGDCWYLRYRAAGQDFDLMIIKDTVVRLEIGAGSKLRTLSGVAIGSDEAELARVYGARLDTQPHKYDPAGHTVTVKASDGAHGLRFETSRGKVTAIQSGPWEHLHYVEGCG